MKDNILGIDPKHSYWLEINKRSFNVDEKESKKKYQKRKSLVFFKKRNILNHLWMINDSASLQSESNFYFPT